MTGCSKLLSTYTPCAGNKKVKIVDGSLSAIARTEAVKISPSITLHDVLHVPKLSCNLVSISKITNNLNVVLYLTLLDVSFRTLLDVSFRI